MCSIWRSSEVNSLKRGPSRICKAYVGTLSSSGLLSKILNCHLAPNSNFSPFENSSSEDFVVLQADVGQSYSDPARGPCNPVVKANIPHLC